MFRVDNNILDVLQSLLESQSIQLNLYRNIITLKKPAAERSTATQYGRFLAAVSHHYAETDYREWEVTASQQLTNLRRFCNSQLRPTNRTKRKTVIPILSTILLVQKLSYNLLAYRCRKSSLKSSKMPLKARTCVEFILTNAFSEYRNLSDPKEQLLVRLCRQWHRSLAMRFSYAVKRALLYQTPQNRKRAFLVFKKHEAFLPRKCTHITSNVLKSIFCSKTYYRPCSNVVILLHNIGQQHSCQSTRI